MRAGRRLQNEFQHQSFRRKVFNQRDGSLIDLKTISGCVLRIKQKTRAVLSTEKLKALKTCHSKPNQGGTAGIFSSHDVFYIVGRFLLN